MSTEQETIEALQSMYSQAELFHKSGIQTTLFDNTSALFLFAKSSEGFPVVKEYSVMSTDKRIRHQLRNFNDKWHIEVTLPPFKANCKKMKEYLTYIEDSVEVLGRISELINI